MTQRARLTVATLLLAALVVAVFHSVARYGFLGLDDPRFVTANAHVKAGLTAGGLRWALTTRDLGFYAPATALSHMLDVAIFGLDARGHHVTNLLLHLGSTLLLFFALHAMTSAVVRSFFVAAIFAIHPLHVEPVAWIAERKELLCGFFWMAALLAYAYYAKNGGKLRYAAVVACCAGAFLSKSMAVTLPLTLLLLDVWPLRRWSAGARPLLVEKLPMLLPLPLVVWATLHAQEEMGALGTPGAFPLGERIANALFAYATYLGKTLVPLRLAALYPFEHGAMPLWKPLAGVAVLAAGSAIAFVTRRTRPYLATGWLWYVGTLVPVIGLVHVGSQSIADRYTYIPLIGIALAAVWAIGEFVPGRVASVAGAAVLVLFGALSYAQVATWRDDESLYRRMLAVSPRAILGYFNLGNHYLFEKNDPGTAATLYQQALAIDPRFGDIHLNLATALARQGKIADAVPHFREAARLKPELADAHLGLATVLMQSKDFAAAAREFKAYCALRPDDPKGLSGLGLVDGELGDWAGAVAALTRATELVPKDGSTWALLGFASLRQGARDRAAEAFTRAIELAPSLPQPHYYLGMMAVEDGNLAAANAQLEALRSLAPPLAASLEEQIARFSLGGTPGRR